MLAVDAQHMLGRSLDMPQRGKVWPDDESVKPHINGFYVSF